MCVAVPAQVEQKCTKCYTNLGSVQFRSFAQSCPTLCNPMDCSTPGFPAHHQLLELTQIHVHRVGDASNHFILCHPLLLLPSIFPSIRVFSESVLHIRWPKYWSFSFNISTFSEHSGLISFISSLVMLLPLLGSRVLFNSPFSAASTKQRKRRRRRN